MKSDIDFTKPAIRPRRPTEQEIEQTRIDEWERECKRHAAKWLGRDAIGERGSVDGRACLLMRLGNRSVVYVAKKKR